MLMLKLINSGCFVNFGPISENAIIKSGGSNMSIVLSKHQDIMKAFSFFIKPLKNNTARAYGKDILDFIASNSDINIKSCVEYFAELKRQGFSKSSIERKRAALSKFFQFLTEYQLLQNNPLSTQTFKMFFKKIIHEIESSGSKDNRKPPARYLGWVDIEKMIAVCGDDIKGLRDKTILLLGTYEGLRRSEIADLKWTDIQEDPNGVSLKVRASKDGIEIIELHKRVLEALEQLKEKYQKFGLLSEYIIVGLTGRNIGGKLTPVAINNIVKNIAKKAGVKRYEEITAHDLRHTCAVQLLLHGASIEKVSRHLRHKNIQTTMIYLKTLELHNNSAVKYLP